MSKDISLFFKTLQKYIKSHGGSVRDTFHFSQSAYTNVLLEDCPTYLIHYAKTGSYLFHIYEPLESIYILLEGNCCVEKYKRSGAVVTDHARHPLQIFGLHESLAEIPYHTATISCITDCVYVRIPVEVFLDLIRSDRELMWTILQFMACFTAEYIESSDILILNDPECVILSKLYRYCIGKDFPVTVHYRKEDLARDLNMNLRTMYRYLDRFYRQNLLSTDKGKIMITENQHRKLGEFLGKL